MATDITSSEVHALINSSETSISLAAQIDHADLMVTENLANAGLSAARQRMITLYLAAHFATLTLEKGGLTHKEVGESVEKYASINSTKGGQGLGATLWGQQAIAFDTSGTLASMAAPIQKAELRVV
jgi:hypothetical protein